MVREALAAGLFRVEEWWWRHVTHRGLFRVLDGRVHRLPWGVVRQLVVLEARSYRQPPLYFGELPAREVWGARGPACGDKGSARPDGRP